MEHNTVTAQGNERAIVGKYGTAVANGVSIAGHGGKATAGNAGTAIAGDHGTAIAGEEGIAVVGDYGTATAGENGVEAAAVQLRNSKYLNQFHCVQLQHNLTEYWFGGFYDIEDGPK
jgi:hypothetical protein